MLRKPSYEVNACFEGSSCLIPTQSFSVDIYTSANIRRPMQNPSFKTLGKGNSVVNELLRLAQLIVLLFVKYRHMFKVKTFL